LPRIMAGGAPEAPYSSRYSNRISPGDAFILFIPFVSPMKLSQFVLVLALFSLGFSAALTVDVIDPPGDVELYNGSSFNVSVNVSCWGSDCGNVSVSLMYAEAPQSCRQILAGNPGASNAIYLVCPETDTCVNVFCDMGNGGWASIFVMEEDLEFTDRDCVLNNNNDDMDSSILWTDLSAKVAYDNTDYSIYQSWYTWLRNGTEDMSADYLPDMPGGLENYARPVPLPASNKTIWFDWEDDEVVWGSNSVPFSSLGLDDIYFTSYGGNSENAYFISDGVNMIHVGEREGSDAVVLVFDFTENTVSGEPAEPLDLNNWWNTEQDASLMSSTQ